MKSMPSAYAPQAVEPAVEHGDVLLLPGHVLGVAQGPLLIGPARALRALYLGWRDSRPRPL